MSRFLAHIFVVALILAWVSPVCQTRAGAYTLLEICGVDGVKTVSIPSGEAPADQEEDHHKSASDCAFCFAAAHFSGVKAVYTAAILQQTFESPDLRSDAFSLSLASLHALPRGPPVSFS